jgi:hypothetical protein
MRQSGSPYLDLSVTDESLTLFEQVGVVTSHQQARMNIAGEIRDTKTVCTAVWLAMRGEAGVDSTCQLIAFHNAEVTHG